MNYHFKIHKEGTGFWAQCIELPGIFTQGDSKEELERNMREALNLFVDEAPDSRDLAALPDYSIKSSKTIVEVPLDSQIAFAFLMRYWRLKYGFTQKEAARKIGFDTIYSYQRLETKRCNPSLKIMSMVKKVYPEFSIDSTLSH